MVTSFSALRLACRSAVVCGVLVAAVGPRVVAQRAVAPQYTAPPTDSWPTYHGDYTGRHYSPLTQIDTSNVKQLTLLWSSRPVANTDERNSGGEHRPGDPYYWAGPSTGGSVGPAEPIVVDGTIYISTADHAWALDAFTGRQLWHYFWKTSGGTHIGNRGMAKLDDTVYFATPDCYLVALDAATGKERWHSQIADIREFRYCSPAPTIVKNHVIEGMSGDGMDSQGWLSAFDPETGALQWRWYTTPQNPEDPGYDTWPDDYSRKHANGMPWQMPTYDPELNLLYVTTGNPNPVFAPRSRPGDNAYSNSVAALNPDTGQMAWYFQFTPHETHDWDTAQVPMLVDGTYDGQPRKMLACACANGYFFLLDRATGENLITKPFTTRPNNTVSHIDETGHLVNDPKKEPAIAGTLVYPGKATNWYPPSFSPQTGLAYVAENEGYALIYLTDDAPRPAGWGGIGSGQASYGRTSAIKAIDYRTGVVKWSVPDGGGSGLLSTAGGLLFGSVGQYFAAVDASTGAILWHTAAAGPNNNGPVTFMLDGKQIVLITSGGQLYAFGLS